MINQFVASITHKPLESKIDQARVRAFISALRDCLSMTGRKPVDRVEKVEPVLSDEEVKEMMKHSIEQIKHTKKTLRREQ